MPVAGTASPAGASAADSATSVGPDIFGALLEDLFPDAAAQEKTSEGERHEETAPFVWAMPVAVETPAWLVPAFPIQPAEVNGAPATDILAANPVSEEVQLAQQLAVAVAGLGTPTEAEEKTAAETAVVPAQGTPGPANRSRAIAFAVRVSELGAPVTKSAIPGIAVPDAKPAAAPVAAPAATAAHGTPAALPTPAASAGADPETVPGSIPRPVDIPGPRPVSEERPAATPKASAPVALPDAAQKPAGPERPSPAQGANEKQEKPPEQRSAAQAQPRPAAQGGPEQRESRVEVPAAGVPSTEVHAAPVMPATQPPSAGTVRGERAEIAPASPAHIEPPAPPAAHRPTEPVRDIELTISGRGPERVDVRVAERGGEVRVTVHTSEGRLNASLREGLGELTGRLADRGFRAETWYPGARVSEPVAELRTARQESAGWDRQQQPQERQPDQQPRRQRDPDAPRWVAELENDTPERTPWLTTSLP